jgi:phosphoglycerate dehydrogenase-like enzyme
METWESRGRLVEVAIATPLEKELVREIEDTDARLQITHDPTLLPPPRYPSDHKGDPDFRRDAEGERRWSEMLETAEVLFGTPGDSAKGLADAIRRGGRLKWIQATSAGAGEQVKTAGLSEEDLGRVAVTTASGVHATPLAEFCLLGLLALKKDLPRLLHDKSERHWDHYPMQELRGKTVLVVGLGKIGLEVARLARCFGMHTVGLKRQPEGDLPEVDELYPSQRLKEIIPRADAVVVTLPLTEETSNLIDRGAIGLMKHECIFVNVGRGGVVDEDALVGALREKRIAGAALDVFREEPLPSVSPLWELPNVLVSPHTAALSISENERIVELFKENLKRYLDGKELLNRVDPKTFY